MSAVDAELCAGIERRLFEARPFEGRLFEGGAVLELSGTVDVSNVLKLKEEAVRLADGGGTVIVDWVRCDRVDAAALQTLLALKRHVEAAGGALRVGRDSSAIRAWLNTAGAGSLLPAPVEPALPEIARRS